MNAPTRLLGLLVAITSSGCSLLGFFDEAPAGSCEENHHDRVTEPCGICGGGNELHRVCVGGVWVPEYCGDDPLDRDFDGYANAGCAGSAEPCCAGVALDCNDREGGVHPDDPECFFDDGTDDTPETRPCATECGSEGTQTCTGDCTWGGCVPPDETCNGVDDDCDGATDEGFPCSPGASVTCTTSCGTVGSGPCTDACNPPTGADCAPPTESCNGVDDDCDTETDDGFACPRGQPVGCTTTCGSTGTGTCLSSCEIPSPEHCTPPAESCNGEDDDCDDATDEDFDCVLGTTTSCTTTCDTIGTGACTADCSTPAPADCIPPDETCNGLDDDCDTVADDGFECVFDEAVTCTTTCGSTGTGLCTDACEIPTGAACVPPTTDICNGADDDCDTVADEGFPCTQSAPGIPCTTTCGSEGWGYCTADCELPSAADCGPPPEECNGLDDDCDTVPDNGFACTPGAPVSCVTSCLSAGTGVC
ncbi:MAG: hypothetical protein JXB32_25835, partial [Deltaproteobacteria bacterium]|nr:hypothetical protein [Deltaproteobacteria bacterium]